LISGSGARARTLGSKLADQFGGICSSQNPHGQKWNIEGSVAAAWDARPLPVRICLSLEYLFYIVALVANFQAESEFRAARQREGAETRPARAIAACDAERTVANRVGLILDDANIK
jgi:hypothetical protein